MKQLIFFLLLSVSAIAQDSTKVVVMQGYSDSGAAPIRVEAGQTLFSMSAGYFINEPRYRFYRQLHEFSQEGDFMGHEQRILDEFGRFLEESSEISEELSSNSISLMEASERLKMSYDEKILELEGQVSIMSKNNHELKEQLNVLEKTKVKKGGWIAPASIGVVIGTFATLLLVK